MTAVMGIAKQSHKLSGLVDEQGDEDLSPSADKQVEIQADNDILARVRAGDREAYRTLVEKYERRLFALALDIVRSKEDAEDIVQESFVKAYLSLKDFRGTSAFYTWIYRITYNMALDYRRKFKRRGGNSIPYEEFQEASGKAVDTVEENRVSNVRAIGGTVEGPQEALIRKEDGERISKALSQLSEEHRVAITLREVDGLSYDEIADATGTARGTVMSRLHYARHKLQSLLRGGE